MNDRPAISLPRFAGPLDLLLELVRKNQLDIADIPIAEVTRQYLGYMHQAAELDIDLGAEFAYIAASLIQLKARSLLPLDPVLSVREPDSRREFRELLDQAQVQRAAEFLQQQLEVTGATWTRPAEAAPAEPDVPADAGAMNLFDLVRLAKTALETARTYEVLNYHPEEISIEHMISWLEPHLATMGDDNSLPFDPLLSEQPDRPRQIVLFLAVLELSRAGAVRLRQNDAFAPIHLCRPTAYGTTVP